MKRFRRFPYRAVAEFSYAAVFLVLAGLVLSGCSGGPRRMPSNGSTVLPYSVGVFLKASVTAPEGAESILETVCTALEADDAIVSRALALSSTTTADALREGRNMDFLIGVRLKAEEILPEPVVSSGDAALEVLAWLFGGLPSWFVPTLEYPLTGEMELEVIDLNDRKVRDWLKLSGQPSVPTPAYKLRSSGGSRFLSLVDRSGGQEGLDNYLLSIVMPPMYVSGDPEAVRDALNEEALAGFLGELLEELRGHLGRDEEERSLRVVFPAGLEGSSFAFDLVSAAGIRVLDLHRLAEETERYRWVLRGDELQRVNGILEREGRARVEVPGGIPLVVGKNLIKVRALRNDGTRISRTTVIFSGR